MKNIIDIQETQQYILFLEKSLKSDNFKNNDPVRYEEAKKKLEKARLRIKLLK